MRKSQNKLAVSALPNFPEEDFSDSMDSVDSMDSSWDCLPIMDDCPEFRRWSHQWERELRLEAEQEFEQFVGSSQ